MGKNKKNIVIDLNHRMDNMLRIGKPKHKNSHNPNQADGIHSIASAKSTRQTINALGQHIKSIDRDVRKAEQIRQEHIQSYFDTRRSCSAFTLKRELSSINKVLGTNYTSADFNLPRRTAENIVNNRGIRSDNHTSDLARNQQQLDFVRATGVRRSSIDSVKPSQAIWNDAHTQVIGFSGIIEKGGKERCVPVLIEYREQITALVQASLKNGEDTTMLTAADRNANPHFCRAEYCDSLYRELEKAREDGIDFFDGKRDLFYDDRRGERAMERYGDTYLDRDVELLAICSQALGHNRLDVLKSYLEK